MLTGYRTYLVAALMALLPMASEMIAGVNWVSVLTNAGVPQPLVIPLASALAAGVMTFMRSITTTAPGKSVR